MRHGDPTTSSLPTLAKQPFFCICFAAGVDGQIATPYAAPNARYPHRFVFNSGSGVPLLISERAGHELNGFCGGATIAGCKKIAKQERPVAAKK